MNPLPACESLGVVNLCDPAPTITAGSWFLLQAPNLLWFLAAFVLVAAGLLLPFPTKPIRAEAEGKGKKP